MVGGSRVYLITTDVLSSENCGVVHIHENVKVVGGSRAEDHMSKCAMTDVYELHQNSQDLAVQCDPLSEVVLFST